VGGKLVQTLDSGVGWGRGNFNGNGDGEFFVGMGKISWGRDGDGENFPIPKNFYTPKTNFWLRP